MPQKPIESAATKWRERHVWRESARLRPPRIEPESLAITCARAVVTCVTTYALTAWSLGWGLFQAHAWLGGTSSPLATHIACYRDLPILAIVFTLFMLPATIALHTAFASFVRRRAVSLPRLERVGLWTVTSVVAAGTHALQRTAWVVLIIRPDPSWTVAPALRPFFTEEPSPWVPAPWLLLCCVLLTVFAGLHAQHLLRRVGSRPWALWLGLAAGVALAWSVPSLRALASRASAPPEIRTLLEDDDASREATERWLRTYLVTDTDALGDCLSPWREEACPHYYEEDDPRRIALPRLHTRAMRGLLLELDDAQPAPHEPTALLELPCDASELRYRRGPGFPLTASWPPGDPGLWAIEDEWLILKAHWGIDAFELTKLLSQLRSRGVRRVTLAAEPGSMWESPPKTPLRVRFGVAPGGTAAYESWWVPGFPSSVSRSCGPNSFKADRIWRQFDWGFSDERERVPRVVSILLVPPPHARPRSEVSIQWLTSILEMAYRDGAREIWFNEVREASP